MKSFVACVPTMRATFMPMALLIMDMYCLLAMRFQCLPFFRPSTLAFELNLK